MPKQSAALNAVPVMILFPLLICQTLPVQAQEEFSLRPEHLRCEYAVNPLGVDLSEPRLFWQVTSEARSQVQSAYQILVASSPALLAEGRGDLWDSGKVSSDRSIHVPYAGMPLKSSQQLFWKLRVWDGEGRVSAWSEPATWTMGLLTPAEWRAAWIGLDGDSQTLLLRRTLDVKPGLKRALIHVCGLGQCEVSVNGERAGVDLLAPGWTKYDKTCLYETLDVTAQLQEGDNALGLVLGNGMYNVRGGRFKKFTGSFGPLKAIAHLRLDYVDGSSEVLGTDEQWRAAPGPITFSCVYGGEDYDARLAPEGWDRPGFDDSDWRRAVVVEGPGGVLRGHGYAAPPIRAQGTLLPVAVNTLEPDVTVYDLGQNVSLMPHITVRGERGAVVRIIPAETLHDNGRVDRTSVGRGLAYWQYTLAGSGRESWFPKFFYHGSRFLQVECTPASPGAPLPKVELLEGIIVHTSSEPVGSFACSNDLFNRVRTLIRWAQRSNLVSVISDCPHRERLGWLEQYHLNGPSLRYEFDLARIFTKGMNDMADSQRDSGLVPDIAPEYVRFSGGFLDSPEWGSACILVPWQQYLWTGDQALIARYYDVMRRYVAYLGSLSQGHIVSHGLGDWYDIGPKAPGYSQLTPIPLTATALYYYDAWVMSRSAALLGKTDDAAYFEQLAAHIKAAFNREFFDAEKGYYASGSQCANAMPLYMDLVPPRRRQSVLDQLVKDASEKNITAGDVGYRYLLRALAEGGRSDVIFSMNNQSERPGYGYQLRMGATSLTEAWNARPASSQNHFMLGQIMEWFYHDLVGIGVDPAGPGFKRIIIRPQPVGDITWAKASYDSLHGPIAVHWRRDAGSFKLDVTIPANTTAMLYLPSKPEEVVTESGKVVQGSRDILPLRPDGAYRLFRIGSGSYAFESKPVRPVVSARRLEQRLPPNPADD